MCHIIKANHHDINVVSLKDLKEGEMRGREEGERERKGGRGKRKTERGKRRGRGGVIDVQVRERSKSLLCQELPWVKRKKVLRI